MPADATCGGVVTLIAAGLAGGLLSSALVSGARLQAQDAQPTISSTGFLIPARDYRAGRVVQVAKLDGDGSGLYFYNKEDHNRMMAGIYPEIPALPLLSLAPDGAGNSVKGLLRLAGNNHSGVVVIKDNGDHDRLVLGLAINHRDEEPFLAYFDKSGKKLVFGRF